MTDLRVNSASIQLPAVNLAALEHAEEFKVDKQTKAVQNTNETTANMQPRSVLDKFADPNALKGLVQKFLPKGKNVDDVVTIDKTTRTPSTGQADKVTTDFSIHSPFGDYEGTLMVDYKTGKAHLEMKSCFTLKKGVVDITVTPKAGDAAKSTIAVTHEIKARVLSDEKLQSIGKDVTDRLLDYAAR